MTSDSSQIELESLATRGAWVPGAALTDPLLSATDKTVFSGICLHADRQRRAWPSKAVLAKIAGVSERTVCDSLRRLEQQGHLEITRRRGQSSVYEVIGDPGSGLPGLDDNPGSGLPDPQEVGFLGSNGTQEVDFRGVRKPASWGSGSGLPPNNKKNNRKNNSGASPRPYAFAGKVIRLNESDFETWRKSYSAIDLMAELQSRDDWLATQPAARQKTWFPSTSSWLARKNQEARAAKSSQPSYDPDSW